MNATFGCAKGITPLGGGSGARPLLSGFAPRFPVPLVALRLGVEGALAQQLVRVAARRDRGCGERAQPVAGQVGGIPASVGVPDLDPDAALVQLDRDAVEASRVGRFVLDRWLTHGACRLLYMWVHGRGATGIREGGGRRPPGKRLGSPRLDPRWR